MSIYATIVSFDNDFEIQQNLEAQGTSYVVIGKEMENNAPYVYVASHRTANEEFRGGHFSVSYTVPWCSKQPYLRVSSDEKFDGPSVDVLLDLKQVKELRDSLTHFIDYAESEEWTHDAKLNTESGHGPDADAYVPTEDEVKEALA